ncbi:MAG: (Fe-S)-binding protein [Bacillota bacterium]
MSIYDSLAAVQSEIDKCMRCGNCQAFCPIYRETRNESGVARGKIALAEALLMGRLQPSKAISNRLDLCLTCKACQANCPSGVRVDRIIYAARALLFRSTGLPLLKKTAFYSLKRQTLMGRMVRAAGNIQGIASYRTGSDDHRKLRFPLGMVLKRVVPSLPKRSLREELPSVIRTKEKKKRVAFFTGCLTNYVYTDIGKAVVNVLTAQGAEVIIPREQHCCGMPFFLSGDLVTAAAMARSHISIFNRMEYDALVTACPTCAGAFKEHYPELLEDDKEYSPMARKVSNKTYEITEYLIAAGFKLPDAGLSAVVTYHDPCHLGRGCGISSQPREIIKAIPGVRLVEMQFPDRCCGGAGSFSLFHYQLSMDITLKKVADIQGTGAQLVITGCPACRMQITDGLNRSGSPQSVLHTVQLLERAYKLGNYAQLA